MPNNKNILDSLPDQNEQDILNTLPDQESSSNKLIPLIKEGVSDIPGMQGVDTVGKAINWAGEGGTPLRRMINEGIGMTMGGAVAGNIGAGVGNVIGGELTDIEDHPEKGTKALEYLSTMITPGSNSGMQFMQDYQNDPEGTIQTVKQELSKVGIRFGLGFTAQIVSKLIMGMAPQPGGALDIGSKTIPGLEEELKRRGYSPTPDKFTKSRVASVVKTAADQGMFSGDMTEALLEKDQGIALKRLDDTTTRLAGGLTEKLAPSDIANTLLKSENLGEADAQEVARQKYNNPALNGVLERVPIDKQVDTGLIDQTGKSLTKTVQDFEYQRTGGINIPVTKFKNLAEEHLADSELGNSISNPEHLNSVLNKVQTLEPQINFATAHNIRSELLALARESNSPNAQRILNDLVHNESHGIESLMEDASTSLKKGDPQAYQQYLDAKVFYRTNKEIFNNELVSKIFIQAPQAMESMGRRITLGGNTTQIGQLFRVINRIDEFATMPEYAESFQKTLANASPETQAYIHNLEDRGISLKEDLTNKLRAGTVQDLQARYTVLDNKNINKKTVSYLGMQSDIDPNTNPEGAKKADLLFGKKGAKILRDELKYADLATRNSGKAFDRAMYLAERIGGGAVGAGVGGIVGHPWAGFATGEIAGVVGVPKFASYLMTDPTGQRYFLDGVKMMAESKSASEIKMATDFITKAATSLITHYLQPFNEAE